MNKVFFTDLYINIILYIVIMLFTIITSTYILLDNDCNLFIRILSIFALIAVVFLLLKKETYLPFLGTTFIPANLFIEPQYPEGANLNYSIDMSDYEDGTKVIYWASNNTGFVINNPYDAYKGFSNSGLAIVKNKRAYIRIYCPDKYKVNKAFTIALSKHFHYRIISKDSGFISPVQTFYVDC